MRFKGPLAVCRPKVIGVLPLGIFIVGLILVNVCNYYGGRVSLENHVVFFHGLGCVNAKAGVWYGALCEVNGACGLRAVAVGDDDVGFVGAGKRAAHDY